MLRLQETKKGLAQAALGEGGTIKLHKLSVKELKAVRYVSNPSILPRIRLLSFATVVRNGSKRRPPRRPKPGAFAVLNRTLESYITFNSVRL